MTKLFATALCTAASVSLGMLFVATTLVVAGQTVAAGVCLLVAGVVLYGLGLAVAWKVNRAVFRGK